MAEPLTIESSAAISAFIQELSIKAQGGKPVDEETLALRLLATEHASPDYDLSTIHSSNAGNAPVTASADGDDKFAKLTALMMGDTKPAEEQVSTGQVPKPPPIVILPGYDIAAVQDNYNTLMDANSMIQLYSNLMQVQQKPDGFDITTEAAAAYNFQAKTAYDAMAGPLAGFFMFDTGSTQKYSNQIPKDQIHDKFLGAVFDNFGFDPDTKKQLDGQLTTFVAGLSKIAPGKANSIDFSLRLGLVPRRNVTGDVDNPTYIYQPTIFLIRMSFDSYTFYQSTGKNSGVDKIDFNFNLSVTKFSLNARKFEQNRAKFDQMFQLVTDSNLRAYSQLLNKQLKTNEANPGDKN
ncbi:hypothetical protein EDB81DRAFT_758573 [Dactylonectria macrodidyma]|uniref:Uncharacterized protein n=1 Tax=Dactylonectria macrodidyma TaxID=307937 RepID=A0A9P9F747_9HYPO|nr:hypothetical protein EDB81DRAFT_758573 [Dactylonectria macrodidyma]